MGTNPRMGQLEEHLQRMRAGDLRARDELLRLVGGQLERLTHKMLQGFPGVRRWEQTDDVLQNALLRLLLALKKVQPASMREFFALSAEQIRRELLDLARHYYGPQGLGARHATPNGEGNQGSARYDQADNSGDPGSLALWTEFHRHVENLADTEREVVGLLFYQELTQAEAATILQVTVRTVQRRWHAALLRLHEALKNQ